MVLLIIGAREIGNEDYNYVEPNGVVQINTKVEKQHNDKNSSSFATKPHGNHNHTDPDQAATVIMDYNPYCGKGNIPVKMNSDPDHKAPSQKGAVLMETDPIYISTIRDDKLYGVTNIRREISKENYNYVEPDEVI